MRHTHRTRRTGARAVALATMLALALTGCVSWFQPNRAPTTSVPTGEDVPAALAPYYHQVLSWRGCGDGMQCTSVTAPLDWSNPEGDTLELALIRQYATGGSPRGSLLVNPGGPGGSGVDFIRDSVDFATSERLQREYTIVGFDPRGVGASTAVTCGDDAVLDDYIYGVVPEERGSDAWFDETERRNAEFGAECLADTGELLGLVDTRSAARDLDLIRAALGDETLTYLGYSYGTYLGAVYAELFPDRAGRLVLDGAIDPSADESEFTLAQAQGFEGALRAYLADCVDRSDCPFTGTVDEAETRVAAIMRALDANPLPAPDGRVLGSSTMFTAIILPLYNRDNWDYLDQLFTDVEANGTEVAFFLADAYNDRESDGSYTTNTTQAFLAINCLDMPSDPDRDHMRAEAEELAAAAPVFGPWMSYGGAFCPQWPFSAERPREAITAPGSPDILVVGTTGDPATPYRWAEALASQLENGHLVTYDGEGHTAYGSSTCVTDTVDDFFVDGDVPASDPLC
ncbi:alpha/beta hydrolase [Homoserinibacter sp. GY 40078]|uniref:alpha/beta hydrolase n=1 Tax=Homoserinibacter sp. GY 40078 TaxID=2603275 RepID=UPI0011C82FFF|nr:alpha/beta hydrolase [Homoserinibacter sp. GY 40078]TXK18436.1 alpha/beta hydrolase [Homoserinibacter sp. GY 40078]